LDELVEREIAVVVQKNEKRKKRRGGKEVAYANPSGNNRDVNDRLEILENFIEK
jgi:hypothetical protein